jgi:hypothetical protein
MGYAQRLEASKEIALKVAFEMQVANLQRKIEEQDKTIKDLAETNRILALELVRCKTSEQGA